MFPSGNANAGLGFNKHNQYMAQPPHFLPAPGTPIVPVPGPNPGAGSDARVGAGSPLRSIAPVMPLNIQGCIDWAQLAQQWIHMRDSTPAPSLANFSMNMPVAPPPPFISNAPEYHNHNHIDQGQPQHHQPKMQTRYEEHGEAEMDMDMDEEENVSSGRAANGIGSLPPGPSVTTQSQWIDGSSAEVPITNAPSDAAGTQQWTNWSSQANSTSHIPSLLKLNVCNPNEQQHLMHSVQQTLPSSNNSGCEIDANKRKMLPAWIRDGLEKMEREKLRQLERQQPATSEKESSAINVKQVSSKTLTTSVNLLNVVSRSASDSEDSIAAPEEAMALAQLIGNDVLCKTNGSDEEIANKEKEERHQQSIQHDTVCQQRNATETKVANAEAALSGKNYEERLADLMLIVRRTLTEILLETTNEEIAAIATETIKAHRAKASSAQVILKSALSSITGNLGLAAYGDSSSESEEDDNSDNDGGQVEQGIISTTKDAYKSTEVTADELRARIRKSKRAFEKVIDDIEERVSLQEQMDEQKLQQHRKLELERTEIGGEQRPPIYRTESPAKELRTTTKTTSASHEKSQHFNSMFNPTVFIILCHLKANYTIQCTGKRLSRKERTTRFSDNKDGNQASSYASQVAAVAVSTQSNIVPQKLRPVPNPATNLLQIPESMASMLNAADKALDKAHKTTRKSKGRRQQSSSSSSTSSSGNSSSSSSNNDSNTTSSNSTKTSSNTDGSGNRSSFPVKKHDSIRSRQGRGNSNRQQRSDASRDGRDHKARSRSSKHSYSRYHGSRESQRHRDRDRDRERKREIDGDHHNLHYISHHNQRRPRQQRDSSNSGEEDGSNYQRNSRHSNSRSHHSSNYCKHREKTRSRSNTRSTHISHSSASSSATHQKRKRH
ncbi:hypothetical protein KR044_008686 [Drosophila immigrans]|nr:hypothetical protein KR044_008686 [Drosophila immigrans]